MKTNRCFLRLSDGGIALILTLAFLALITITVLAFFTSVTTELASSKSYASGASAKELSDSAVSAVIGTIKEATSGGSTVAWTSQPGLVRTYDDTGTALQVYKLYSSDLMVESAFDPTHDVDTAWKTKPGLFTDLNMPLSKTTSGTATPTLSYPIVDPAADLSTNPTTGVEGFTLTNAPAYDKTKPAAPDNNPAPMPVKWIYVLKDGSMTAPDKYDTVTGIASFTTGIIPTGTNPIVGRMAFWADDETAKININTASEGTFWDTPVCHTGSSLYASSTYVADPDKVFEYDLASYMGAQKEFQRYAGHPATTCLSTVFGKSLIALNPSMTRKDLIQKITDITPRVTVYSDSSGADYSSQGGTRRAGKEEANTALATETYYAGFKLNADRDRLYGSVDELIFNASTRTNQLDKLLATPEKMVEQAKFFITAQSRAPEVNLFNKPRVAIWPLQVTPDTRPASYRPYPGGNRTYFDQLIAFCASLGVHSGSNTLTPYYFTRQDPTSSTIDWSTRNQAIYKYLQALTKANVPGFGRNFAAKYSEAERDQILTEIYDYIRCTNLIDYSDPSAPNAAYTATGYKYAVNNTATPINVAAASPNPAYTIPPNSIYLYPATQNIVNTSRGQVVPIAPPAGTPGAGTRGIGRIATISEMALVVLRTGPRQDGLPADTKATTSYVAPAAPPPQDITKTDLQIVLIPERFSPMAGFSVLAHNMRIRYKKVSIMVDGVDAFSGKPNQSGMYETGRQTNLDGWDAVTGGIIGYRGLIQNASSDSRSWLSSPGAPVDSLPAYANITVQKASLKLIQDPLFPTDPSKQVIVNMTVDEAVTAGKTITIGGSVDVEIEAPANADPSIPGPIIQKFHFDFPQTTVAVPNRVITAGGEPSFVNTAGKRGGRVTPGDRSAGEVLRMIYTTRKSKSTDPNAPSDSLAPNAKNYQNFDIVRGVVPVGGTVPLQGDLRIIAALPEISPTDNFFKPPLMPIPAKPVQPYFDPKSAGVHSLRAGGKQNAGATYGAGGQFGGLVAGFPPRADQYDPIAPEGILGVKNSLGEVGDWDTGPFLLPDGPLCNKPDEGTDKHRGGGGSQDTSVSPSYQPYINDQIHEDGSYEYAGFFSPNRMIPSPVMLGSLPTGVVRRLPWQTLLFRPAVDYLPGKTSHPGGTSGGAQLPDHTLLDLFWMPVVEPYAISEPMATAGKINLNYQIVPFTHIKRDTGLRAVMKAVKITALDSTVAFASVYKEKKPGFGAKTPVRYNINMDETLKQFDTERFNKKKAFISASEICEIPLVPSGSTAATLSTFWATRALTGDNCLERPYAHLYSRLTTKSNTYTVHVWVEVLRPVVPRGAANNDVQWAQWNEKKKDQIVSRYRGSTLIERYIDPLDPALANFDETYNGATEIDPVSGNITKAGSLDPFYKFHVLSTKKFGQ